MLSSIDDVTACSDSHNMQLGSKLSSSVLRFSVVQSLLAESAKVLLTAVAVGCAVQSGCKRSRTKVLLLKRTVYSLYSHSSNSQYSLGQCSCDDFGGGAS